MLHDQLQSAMNWTANIEALFIQQSSAVQDHLVITSSRHIEIKRVIQSYLEAMRVRDSGPIWDLSSNLTHEAFEDGEELLRYLETQSPQMMNAKVVEFGEFSITPVGLTILVDLVSTSTRTLMYRSIWLVTPDSYVSPKRMGRDEKWLVGGCLIAPPESHLLYGVEREWH